MSTRLCGKTPGRACPQCDLPAVERTTMPTHRAAERPRPDLARRRFLGYLVAAPTLIVAADLGIDQVHVTLADARPELLFNQLTGGSNTTFTTYTPIRVAAALAKGRLLQ